MPSKWDRVLDQIEFSINNTVCSATDETPARLLFGFEQRGKRNDVLRDLIQQDCNVVRDFDSLRNNAQAKIDEVQRKGAERYNLRRRAAREYKVGDYVEIRNIETTTGINEKLVPKFKGPYVVKKALDRDRYVVADIDRF